MYWRQTYTGTDPGFTTGIPRVQKGIGVEAMRKKDQFLFWGYNFEQEKEFKVIREHVKKEQARFIVLPSDTL